MKKCSFLSFLILLSFLTLIPVQQYQKPIIFADGLLSSSNSSWNRTYTYNPGSTSPKFYDIAEYDDGGFVIVGRASSGTWVLRTDAVGDVLVNETCGGSGGTSVDVCDDGSLVVTYYVGAVLIKISSSGVQVWNRTYVDDLLANDVVVCDDGGFAICGFISPYSYSGQMLLLKTSSSGDEQWRRYYGDGAWGYNRYSAYCLVECTGGGFFLVGYAVNIDDHDADVYVVRTDSNGDMIWNKTLDFEEDLNNDRGVSGVECSDGGFIVVTGSARVIKFDSSGEIMWIEDYAEDPSLSQYSSIIACSVIQCSSGGYCISGRVSGIPAEALLIRTDENGDTQWVHTFSEWPNPRLSALLPVRVIERSSGGFALACTVEIPAVWLIVTPDADTTNTTDTTTKTITTTTTTDTTATTITTTPTSTTPSTDLGDTMTLVAVGGGAVLIIVMVVLFTKRGR